MLQGYLTQALREKGFNAENVSVHRLDKRSRLAIISHLIQEGKILFPKKGAENLIRQLTGFGIEKHDDLADALTIILIGISESRPPMMGTCKEKIIRVRRETFNGDYGMVESFKNVVDMIREKVEPYRQAASRSDERPFRMPTFERKAYRTDQGRPSSPSISYSPPTPSVSSPPASNPEPTIHRGIMDRNESDNKSTIRE